MTDKRALVFWFTGLSGAGKTTIAEAARHHLENDGIKTVIIDGDQIRTHLHRHLGFSEADIKKNNALIAELCESLRDNHDVILVPIISPYIESRRDARARLSPGFFEIFINAELRVVTARDSKGLYAKARAGKIKNLIGFSPNAPYEPPDDPDLVVDTMEKNEKAAVSFLLEFIRECLRKRTKTTTFRQEHSTLDRH